MEKRFMKYIIIFISFIFLCKYTLNAQFTDRAVKRQGKIDKFSLSSFTYASSLDSVKIITFLEIPYSVLQFIKKGNKYVAHYQASISIKDEDEFQRGYLVWKDSILVDEYLDTKSIIKNRKHFSSFSVSKIKDYSIVGELQDLDTRKKGLKNKFISLDLEKQNPVLLEPIFLLDLEGNWGFKNGKIPTYGNIVKNIGDGIELNISGYVDNEIFELEVFITNGTSIDSLIKKKTYQNIKGFFNEYIFIPSNQINSLKNDFTIRLKQKRGSDEKIISFSKYKTGISKYVSNIDLAIKQMKYILDNDEYKKSGKQFRNDKEKLFYTLWKKRDPTPDTEYNELMDEYYKRVVYANENFDGWQPGWETDRGMVYILFGPPDQVERTNSTMANSTFYQIWTYNKINKQFVFRDQNGFGDYRLETPLNGIGLR